MAKKKSAITLEEDIPRDVNELVVECDDLGAAGSELVEAILTAFVRSGANPAGRVREIIIRRRKGTL